MPDWKSAEEELRTMLVGAHDIAQRYGQQAATLVRQLEDEIMVEQERIRDIRTRHEHGESDEEMAEEYATALERIADLNGALQRAREGHKRAQEFFGAERER